MSTRLERRLARAQERWIEASRLNDSDGLRTEMPMLALYNATTHSDAVLAYNRLPLDIRQVLRWYYCNRDSKDHRLIIRHKQIIVIDVRRLLSNSREDRLFECINKTRTVVLFIMYSLMGTRSIRLLRNNKMLEASLLMITIFFLRMYSQGKARASQEVPPEIKKARSYVLSNRDPAEDDTEFDRSIRILNEAGLLYPSKNPLKRRAYLRDAINALVLDLKNISDLREMESDEEDSNQLIRSLYEADILHKQSSPFFSRLPQAVINRVLTFLTPSIACTKRDHEWISQNLSALVNMRVCPYRGLVLTLGLFSGGSYSIRPSRNPYDDVDPAFNNLKGLSPDEQFLALANSPKFLGTALEVNHYPFFVYIDPRISLGVLAKFRDLQTFRIRGNIVSEADWGMLQGQWAHLNELTITHNTSVCDEVVRQWARGSFFRTLSSITFESCPRISADVVPILARFPKLTHVGLICKTDYRSFFKRVGVSKLPEKLTSLSMEFVEICSDFKAFFAALERLLRGFSRLQQLTISFPEWHDPTNRTSCDFFRQLRSACKTLKEFQIKAL